MPQRTNLFQQLIYLIHQQLAPHAQVVESRMLSDKLLGVEREVDIVIEVPTYDAAVLIGIECTARERAATLEWVEQMIGKHLTLPTDELVLVSQSGFTPDATRKAAGFGVHTVSLGEAIAEDWTTIVNKLTHVYLAVPASTPIDGRVTYAGNDAADNLPSLDLDTILYDNQGQELGTINAIAIKGLKDPDNTKYVLTTYPDPGTYQYELDYSPAPGAYHEDAQGIVHEVKQLSFQVQVVVPERIPVELNHRSFKNLQVAYGTFDQLGKGALLTVVENEGGSPTVAIRMPRGSSFNPA